MHETAYDNAFIIKFQPERDIGCGLGKAVPIPGMDRELWLLSDLPQVSKVSSLLVAPLLSEGCCTSLTLMLSPVPVQHAVDDHTASEQTLGSPWDFHKMEEAIVVDKRSNHRHDSFFLHG